MQVLLQSDPNTDGSPAMAQHLSIVVTEALDRFGDRLTRVEAHLAAAEGHAKSAEDKVQCTLEAHLAGSDAIVVKHQAGNAHQAIEGAVRKLRRVVEAQIEKHDPRAHRVPHHGLADEAALAAAVPAAVADPE